MSDATPSLIADRYRLDELIGSGPMGEVWRGYDTRADWVVAVKVLGAKAAGAAARELLRKHAQAVARVIHPNVAMVLDVGEHDGAPFLVMEYLTGLSLGEELAEGGPLKIVEVCDLIGQAAAGLDAAHRAGVVHGEIDPGSFRRAGSGVLKVVGFGLDDQRPSPGEGPYVAPERAAGGTAEASGDLYALGCVCYELLCGRPPFEGQVRDAGTAGGGEPGGAGEPGVTGGEGGEPGLAGGGPGASRASRVEPALPSAVRAEVPAELDRLVLAMIAEDPAQRPAGGEAIRRALAGIARPRANPAAIPVTGVALRDGGLVGGHGGPGASAAHGGGPATAGLGATEIYQLGGPGGAGPRAGDTAVFQAGEPEPGPAPNRKLFLQLGAAVAAIVVVTVGMVMWAGAREQPAGGPTPTAAPTTFATPTETPIETLTESPTGDPSPGIVASILPDGDSPGSLRETAPPKATLGTEVPPGGWGEWLGRFDEAVRYQEREGGINPEFAAKVRQKIQKAARKLDEGKTGSTVGQVAELYQDLRRAQEKGDMDSSGPLANFMNDWRIQAG
ncbi:serine/threonine-protein kinase [Nonomuraea basaltis]|uniref:serine/threonine-protein kinase n=1 Tax=Nonomuraea basaltis TaxID=2495887 RepID=UPI001487420B|nr:serine/threonine-protein kinase [Nonomuraea basaltis]